MNLAVDFGNTTVKAGLFSGTDLISVKPGLTLETLGQLIHEEKPDSVLISTVSNRREEIAEALPFTSGGKPAEFLNHETPVPFINKYETPETLGLDRIAAVAGAVELFPDSNCLVIDMGTCITYDLLTAQGEYLGGGISPGLRMRFKAIHSFTSRLPEVEFVSAPQLIGRSTVSCIQSGVINGVIAELNGIISEYGSKYDRLRIILCGGDMNYFENTLKQAIFAAPELVLRGLNRILRHNA